MHAPFLNVDLAIESRSNLEPLAVEFGSRIRLNFCGKLPTPERYFLTFDHARQPKRPDPAIHALCALVESLSPAGRSLWKRAIRKEFDVGYGLQTDETSSLHFTLRSNTLERVAALGATLGVTFYGPNDERHGIG
jgi:hypothetical protein